MKKLALSFVALMASTSASLACFGGACPPPAKVPEISALDGAAAIAVVVAIVAVFLERRRRA